MNCPHVQVWLVRIHVMKRTWLDWVSIRCSEIYSNLSQKGLSEILLSIKTVAAEAMTTVTKNS